MQPLTMSIWMVALLLPTNGFPPYTNEVLRVTTADTTLAPAGMSSVLQEMMEPLRGRDTEQERHMFGMINEGPFFRSIRVIGSPLACTGALRMPWKLQARAT